ncbi:hypothetical protein ASF90_09755 [Xanthomonas sp. Leaf148]|nr:hypothetical protein ASF90_09755 [Xanthomonas sp. Leaf148]
MLQITFSFLHTIKSLKQKNKLHPQLTRCVRIIKKIFIQNQRARLFTAIRKQPSEAFTLRTRHFVILKASKTRFHLVESLKLHQALRISQNNITCLWLLLPSISKTYFCLLVPLQIKQCQPFSQMTSHFIPSTSPHSLFIGYQRTREVL